MPFIKGKSGNPSGRPKRKTKVKAGKMKGALIKYSEKYKCNAEDEVLITIIRKAVHEQDLNAARLIYNSLYT